MNLTQLKNAAEWIVKLNLTDRVRAVRVVWENATSRLTVLYYVDGPPTDAEEEECEITMAELLAQFPEIKIATTQCLDCAAEPIDFSQLPDLVYRRRLLRTTQERANRSEGLE